MALVILKAGVSNLLVKLGPRGIMVAQANQNPEEFVFIPPPKPREIVNVAGAGDSLVGASIWGLAVNGDDLVYSVKTGVEAARLSLESRFPVSPLLTPKILSQYAKDEL